jgi:hypothetical protein
VGNATALRAALEEEKEDGGKRSWWRPLSARPRDVGMRNTTALQPAIQLHDEMEEGGVDEGERVRRV